MLCRQLPRADTDRASRWRRQKHHFVLCGQRHHFVWLLLLHGMDRPEQIIEPTGRGDPEQALHWLVGFVEEAVRDAHGEPDQVARKRVEVPTVEDTIELTLEHVDEFVLGRMDMRRHERARREGSVPGE